MSVCVTALSAVVWKSLPQSVLYFWEVGCLYVQHCKVLTNKIEKRYASADHLPFTTYHGVYSKDPTVNACFKVFVLNCLLEEL